MALQAHRISLSQKKWSEHQLLGYANNISESKQTYGFCAALLFHVAWIAMCCMSLFYIFTKYVEEAVTMSRASLTSFRGICGLDRLMFAAAMLWTLQ